MRDPLESFNRTGKVTARLPWPLRCVSYALAFFPYMAVNIVLGVLDGASSWLGDIGEVEAAVKRLAALSSEEGS